ncbi:MAG TPA: ATP synthase F1 subunit gamma, partial [Nitrospiraceae bacterium]|nr:ATP synthase F1 subunit gamma [Nitrospiraceae bacterium]
MPSLQSVKRKINSVKKTQKITKAMKMVAAAKLKRAQQRILAFRPYGLRMRQAITDLSVRVNRTAHPLLQKRPVKNVRVSVVTSDRGLCGAFNANIFRKAFQVIEECEARGAKVSVGVVGKKGGDFFRRRQWPIHDPFINIFERLSFEHAIEIGTAGTEAYRTGAFDEIHVVYNQFKSAVQQRVIVEQLLP